MTDTTPLPTAEGYYWFRHQADATTFIALFESGRWWLPGLGCPADVGSLAREPGITVCWSRPQPVIEVVSLETYLVAHPEALIG